MYCSECRKIMNDNVNICPHCKAIQYGNSVDDGLLDKIISWPFFLAVGIPTLIIFFWWFNFMGFNF